MYSRIQQTMKNHEKKDICKWETESCRYETRLFSLNYTLVMTGTVIIVKVNPRLIPLELNNLYLQTQTCMKTYQNHSQTNLLNHSIGHMGKSHQFSRFTPK